MICNEFIEIVTSDIIPVSLKSIREVEVIRRPGTCAAVTSVGMAWGVPCVCVCT